MSDGDTSEAYVCVDIAEEHIEPQVQAEVVNRLDLGQRVDVYEEAITTNSIGGRVTSMVQRSERVAHTTREGDRRTCRTLKLI
ncbi:MAG: hypothetical protein OXT64_17430 [Gammaproteobacteria bacterium]|nr:hypothetical protein [Gammaproteobacteria bacterium]